MMAASVCFLSCSKSGATDERDNATAKALEMSLQYSFVTPLTSMVVTKPETGDGSDGPLIADKLTEGKGGKRGLKTFLIMAAVKLFPLKNKSFCNQHSLLNSNFQYVPLLDYASRGWCLSLNCGV